MRTNRIVYRRDDGQWANKKTDSDRASSLHDTQAEAEGSAKVMLTRSGGGELIVKRRDGKIRRKDTIAPAPDRCPPRDREHYIARESYHVVSRPDGQCSVRKTGEGRASRVFSSKSDAVSFARALAKDRCGELIIHGRDGRIREASSYGKDPYPPRHKR